MGKHTDRRPYEFSPWPAYRNYHPSVLDGYYLYRGNRWLCGLLYTTKSGGPYTYFGITANKSIESLTVTGLMSETTYYFKVRTVTYPHGGNSNTVYSEFTDEISATTSPECEGDFDNDGDVDGSDLAVFAQDFGRTDCTIGPPCEGDFDKDSDVDGSDLTVFAADFGRTDCP